MIGFTLTEEGQNKLCDLLRCNLDVFSWKTADMTGVPRHIAEHRLKNVGATYQRLVDKSFYKQISRNLETEEAKAAFKQMKQLIAELPTLTAPEEKEELIVHLAAVKEVGQILANFIVKRLEEDDPDTTIEVKEELPKPWILFTDGSSCTDGSRTGLTLTNLERAEFTYALRFRFEETNNEAEYKALIAGLRIAKEMGVKNL
nr:reverse transcriptase domain-containing protein [Tanacetum cinerariifolium]